MHWNQRDRLKYVIVVLSITLFSFPTWATEDNFFQWHSTNVQFLRGHDYALGDKQRSIMTLEHANSWKYGDFFVFLDQTWPDNGKSGYYVEPALRFSLSKMTGRDFSYGLLKDVLVATSIEKPKGQGVRYLSGVAFDLNIPGFKFFKTNWYLRDNPDLSGNTHQLTLVWNRPSSIGNVRLLVEGFADFAGSEGSTVAHELIVPRLLCDVGELAGLQQNKVWIGMEWQYWHNKFGVDGVTESVPQLQLKWVF